MEKKVSFRHLDGWLKFLVVIGWINISLSALAIAAMIGVGLASI